MPTQPRSGRSRRKVTQVRQRPVGVTTRHLQWEASWCISCAYYVWFLLLMMSLKAECGWLQLDGSGHSVGSPLLRSIRCVSESEVNSFGRKAVQFLLVVEALQTTLVVHEPGPRLSGPSNGFRA